MAKKDKKPAPVETSDSEAEAVAADKPAKRRSAAEIRHIKKEKQRVAREGSEATRAAAHQYLQQWSSDRESWKFNKARQLWIVRHLYLETQVPSDLFELAIQYLDGSGDVLRKSLVSDARLVAEPMSAITPELQAMRSKTLGLMPSHVTKAEANAARKTKTAKDKTPAAAAATAVAKDGEKAKSSGAEAAPVEKDAPAAADGAVSESTMKRATRIIEVLAAIKPVEPVAPKESKKKRKQATPDASDDDSSDEDEKEKEKKKKSKTEKKEKKSDKPKDKKEKSEKKGKKEKKEKSKSEKKTKSK
ncbi:hypothetical protein GGF42_009470 [Coemansia sp. RSA 2424]|nr:hypothetical protein GGF42_009470 [Coemansia sp. RSA 2424]